MSFSVSHASNALAKLCDVAAERQEELQNYGADPLLPDSEDEADSSSPIMDRFVEAEGTRAVLNMTNFTVREYSRLYNRFHEFILTHWNCGRGKKTQYKPKDVLFMLLTVLKYGCNWDILARTFNIKTPTFEQLMHNFITATHKHIYEELVVNFTSSYTVSKLKVSKSAFKSFPYARYATDVTFQQCFRPAGSMQEGKIFFSGKHKLYGLKVEVSVLPNGLAAFCSPHYPGSKSDISIMHDMENEHQSASKKMVAEVGEEDLGIGVDKFPGSWGILCDKGYQGANEFLRAVTPHKKPVHGGLSIAEVHHNDLLSSDRVIVENYFGRLCSLWTILSNKYKRDHNKYDAFFRLCLAFTNLHVFWHPLRAEDKAVHVQSKNRLYTIGNEAGEKRKRAQRKYRAKRARRLNAAYFDSAAETESASSQPDEN